MSGEQPVHANGMPLCVVPLYLYEDSTIDCVRLEPGMGVYIKAKGTFVGKAITFNVVPTGFKAKLNPPAISPPWPPINR